MLRLEMFKSLEKAVKTIIPQNIKGRTMVFWKKSRCDAQSACAEKSRELIKIIIRDIESRGDKTRRVGEVESSGDKGLDDDCHYDDQQDDKQIPFISKKCRRDIFMFLDRCSDSRGSENDCYLSRHKCNVIALMTIEEALVQVQVGMACGSHIQEQLAKIFEGLHLHLSNTSNFSSTIAIPLIAEKLELKKLQYSGRGMEYLELLSKQQRARE